MPAFAPPTRMSPSAEPPIPSCASSDFAWTDERIDRLKLLWAAGRSASAIANELGAGVSRNAVLGKIHRMGLSGRVAISKPARLAPRPVGATPTVTQQPVPEPAPAPPKVRAGPPSGGIPFMATRSFHCRYAIAGDGMGMTCCGARTAQGSYCERHAALIYAGRQSKEEARIEEQLRRGG